jgi:hypothetical protein
VLLAYHRDQEAMQTWLNDAELTPFTPHTVTNKTGLLEKVRRAPPHDRSADGASLSALARRRAREPPCRAGRPRRSVPDTVRRGAGLR